MPRTQPLEHGQIAADVADRPLYVGDPIPLVCSLGDVAKVLACSLGHVKRMRAKGQLEPFLLDALGTHENPRYSGILLQQFVEKRLHESFINGDLRKRRSFGKPRA
jgi:hypothetical protein